jgi:2-(1,2-epoxy-1,2-dihydrophenyl)acetyl-CoA isomerase
MSQDRIVCERDGAVGWIRINRPERLNAFVGAMRQDLLHALQDYEQDDEVRCIIITGAGPAFSTGGDIAAMSELLEQDDRNGFEALLRVGADIVTQIDSMTKPVIAAINGVAVGAGACLALACDLRIASENASIGFAFMRIGLHPDWGGSYFLPRLVGPAMAAELIFTGGMVSAERAERLGLFNRVVPAAQLEGAARGFAGEVAAAPAGVLADAKRVVRRSLDSTLAEVLQLEIEAQLRTFGSPDNREGIRAFLDKRAPRFNRNPDADNGNNNHRSSVRGAEPHGAGGDRAARSGR